MQKVAHAYLNYKFNQQKNYIIKKSFLTSIGKSI